MEKFADNHNKFTQKMKQKLLNGVKWIKENKVLSISVGAVVLLLVGVCIFAVMKGQKDSENNLAQVGASVEESSSTEVKEVTELGLDENAHEEVNQFVSSYYNALANGDIDTVTSMRNYTEDTEKVKIQKKSEYIENYQNLICYTKEGPIENSYIAYVYYEVKFKGIDTLAPGLNSLFLYPDTEGKLMLGTDGMDEHIANYLKEVSAQDNVVDLFNRVQVMYNEAVESDEQLQIFLADLPNKLKTEVGEELAAAEAPVTEEQPTTTEPEVVEQPETQAPQEVVIETVKPTTTVNVRSSDSETADKIGQVTAGTSYKRLESLVNGWSKIEFEGKEAYVKSEFLEVVDSTTQVVENQETTNNESSNTATSDEVKAPAGKIIVKETVNVRKSASETGERLGVAYEGDQYELIMKQADGWTKINYKGQTGYVKSDFVK